MPSRSTFENFTPLVFRVSTSLIFIVAGVQHLLRPDFVTNRLVAAPFGHWATAIASPKLLVLLMGGVLFGAGLALLTGFATRVASLLLIATLIPITFTVQVGAESLGPLFKNVAIFGSLLHFSVTGGGRMSLDARLPERARRFAFVGGLVASLVVGLIPSVGMTKPVATGSIPKGERVFFIVQQPSQIKAALGTGVRLLKGELFPAREVEVLVCGPGVESLVEGEAVGTLATRATEEGVRIVVCGLSLTQKNIDREKLAQGVVIVENGFVEALERKAEGFLSVEL